MSKWSVAHRIAHIAAQTARRLITYLHHDHQKGRRPRAIYEMATSTSESDHDPQSSDMVAGEHSIRAEATVHGNGHQSGIDYTTNIGADLDGQEMQIYALIPDTIRMGGFPCLSHLSFQRDGQHLHLMAHYRHQLLVQRAYGNYLALGLLQGYIATAADLHVGQLSVNAGLATLEINPAKLVHYLALLGQQRLWGERHRCRHRDYHPTMRAYRRPILKAASHLFPTLQEKKL